nr:hypothetical protein Itr_chr14CG17230 [Ipomoea trifida]
MPCKCQMYNHSLHVTFFFFFWIYFENFIRLITCKLNYLNLYAYTLMTLLIRNEKFIISTWYEQFNLHAMCIILSFLIFMRKME